MEMTMGKIKREDLLSLEAYYKARPEMRLKAIAERKKRTVILGEHLNMIFENKYLMQYQINMSIISRLILNKNYKELKLQSRAMIPFWT